MSAARTRFLQRRSYRQRRVADAARLLPMAGIVLLMLPLLRLAEPDGSAIYPTTDSTAQTTVQVGSHDAAQTSQVGLYIFTLWVALIAVAFGLSRGLRDTTEPEEALPSRAARYGDPEG